MWHFQPITQMSYQALLGKQRAGPWQNSVTFPLLLAAKCGQCHLCVVSGRLDGNLGPSPCLCECMKARRSCVCICDAASCHLFLLYIVYTSAVGVFHANQGGPDKNSTLLQVQPVHQVSFCQDLTDFTITVLPRTVCKRNVTF